MWRWFFRPETMLFLGGVQSLIPYLIWRFSEPFINYNYRISYIPLVIWIFGYAAFWLGAKCAALHRYPPPNPHLIGRRTTYRPMIVILIIALVLQMLAFTRVYGGIPFLLYLSGESHADQAEESTFANAFPGQLGLFLNSQNLLNALVVILILSAVSVHRRRPALFIVAVLTSIAAALSTGKRQNVAIFMIMVACTMALHVGNPIRPILRYLGFRRSKWLSRALMIALPVAFVAFLGFAVTVRTGMSISGLTAVMATYHIGLINFETQAHAAGYGPKRYDILRLTQYMMPDRIYRRLRFAEDKPPRAEPTASAGFYGDLHWNTGLAGVIVFSFFAGWLSKYFFFRARSSLFHLLTYPLMAWTMVAAHSYNHFLHLNFLIMPAILYWILSRFFGVRGVRIRSEEREGRRVASLPRYGSVHPQ